MSDEDVLGSINILMDEEHALLHAAEQGGLDDAQRQRLDSIQVRLDQCWDLLRQRRAKREFGQNPEEAKVRDANTVEHYKG